MSGYGRLSNVDELLRLVEEQQARISSLEQTNSSLLARIETLSSSDKQLQHAERLKNEAEKLSEESRARLGEAEARTSRAEAREEACKARERQLEERAENMDEAFAAKVEEGIRAKVALPMLYAVSFAPSLGAYSVAATIAIAWSRGAGAGAALWASARLADLKGAWGLLAAAHGWLFGLLPDAWPAPPKAVIATVAPMAIVAACAAAAYFAWRAFHAWSSKRWEESRGYYLSDAEPVRTARVYRKVAWIVVLMLVSLDVSLLVAPATPLLWPTWYLVLSIASTVIYHALSNNYDPQRGGSPRGR